MVIIVVRFYSSVAPETTLSAGVTNVSTTITVGSVTGFPPTTPYTLALDYEGIIEELVQVENAAGTTLTVTRAIDGTSAAAHNAGARVRHVSSARDFADSRSHENTGNGVHGLAGGEVIVGTTSPQTLTNKTLGNPTINSATLSGVLAGNVLFTNTWTGDAAFGKFRFNNVSPVTAVSTNHAFQIGLDTGENFRLDTNTIQVLNNGTPQLLGINPLGGNLTSFGGVAADSTVNSYTLNGQVSANLHSSSRASGTSNTFTSRVNGNANPQVQIRANGQIGWGDGTNAVDAFLERTAAGALQITNTLNVTSTITAPTVTTTNVNTTNLAVTGTTTLPLSSATGTAVATAAANFTVLAASVAAIRGGNTTVNVVFTRTGANLVADGPTDPNPGNIADTLAFAILAPYRPNAVFGTERIAGVLSISGVCGGTVGLNPSTGQVEILTLNTSGVFATGQIGRVTFSYPSI